MPRYEIGVWSGRNIYYSGYSCIASSKEDAIEKFLNSRIYSIDKDTVCANEIYIRR